jgi:sterol desaturase/sphingolipid hydroxylase (fatty acid hydroxylase superfamily)
MFPELTALLEEGARSAPYTVVIAATVLWFGLIYAIIAGGAYWLAVGRLPESVAGPGGRTQRLRAGQVKEELFLSVLSILVFAAQATGLVWMLRAGWLAIDWHGTAWHLLWELPALYFWNEVHFFIVHRLLHWPALYRRVHVWHHRSVVTTPFSAYCFHPVESFLLGAVMPLALVLHAFSPWALLGLTIMSLMLNVAGHLPHEQLRSGFAFLAPQSRYHNRHHRDFHRHFGFSFPLLDRWLGGADKPAPGAAR